MRLTKSGTVLLAPLVSFAVSQLVYAGADSEALDDRFCAEVQKWIAETDEPVSNIVHENYEEFVKSKAVAEPIETQQFYSHPLPAGGGIPSVVSCKMKTRGSIAHAHSSQQVPSDWGNGEASCDLVTHKMLAAALSAVPEHERLLAADKIIIDDESLTFMGPMWLSPWPFQSAYTDEIGVVHLRSKALYVPWSNFIPAPAAFKGVYYCHLVSQAYLQALLQGEIKAPISTEPE